jgi:hypothetical protein
MRRLLALLLPVAATLGACTSGSKIMTNGDWDRRPTPPEIARAVDAHVRAVGFVGLAVLRCTVAANGELRGCRVVSESHPGLGLAEAALSLVPHFRAAGKRPGDIVEVPVRMPAPAP